MLFFPGMTSYFSWLYFIRTKILNILSLWELSSRLYIQLFEFSSVWLFTISRCVIALYAFFTFVNFMYMYIFSFCYCFWIQNLASESAIEPLIYHDFKRISFSIQYYGFISLRVLRLLHRLTLFRVNLSRLHICIILRSYLLCFAKLLFSIFFSN